MKSPAIASIEKMLTKIEIAERERFEKRQFRRAAADMLGKASKDALKKRIADAARGKEGADPIDVEALAEQLREQACADETDSKQRRLWATDATIEKLGELVSNGMRRCRPMIVWCDELGGLLHSFDREGHESARDFYLAAWSVQTHRVDRIARGELFLRDLAISIFGAMTPGPFEKYVREAAGGESADGFLQRLQFLVYPDQGAEWRHVDLRITSPRRACSSSSSGSLRSTRMMTRQTQGAQLHRAGTGGF